MNLILNYVILRYFNPAGLHHSGLISENPKGIPNNLFPFIFQVIKDKFKFLKIYGNLKINIINICQMIKFLKNF